MNGASSSGPSDAGTEAEKLARRLQDLQLPIANITRIMSDILPMQAKINDDTKEAVQELVNYYIHRITKKANERCHREQRKTVTAEDILWAMNNVGLANYAGLLTRYLHRYREQDPVRNLRPNIVRPNFELALAPPTPSPPILPISNAPMPGYVYPHFPANVLFYDAAAASMINARNEEMERNDEGPADSSSSSTTNHDLPEGQFKQ